MELNYPLSTLLNFARNLAVFKNNLFWSIPIAECECITFLQSISICNVVMFVWWNIQGENILYNEIQVSRYSKLTAWCNSVCMIKNQRNKGMNRVASYASEMQLHNKTHNRHREVSLMFVFISNLNLLFLWQCRVPMQAICLSI